MTNPLPAPGPVLVAKSRRCPGKLVYPWKYIADEGRIDQWAECLACGARMGLDDDPVHDVPEVVTTASLPEGDSVCPF